MTNHARRIEPAVSWHFSADGKRATMKSYFQWSIPCSFLIAFIMDDFDLIALKTLQTIHGSYRSVDNWLTKTIPPFISWVQIWISSPCRNFPHDIVFFVPWISNRAVTIGHLFCRIHAETAACSATSDLTSEIILLFVRISLHGDSCVLATLVRTCESARGGKK